MHGKDLISTHTKAGRPLFSTLYFLLSFSFLIQAAGFNETAEDFFNNNKLEFTAAADSSTTAGERTGLDYLKYLSLTYTSKNDRLFPVIRQIISSPGPERILVLLDLKSYLNFLSAAETDELLKLLKEKRNEAQPDSGYINFLIGHLLLSRGDIEGAKLYFDSIGAIKNFRAIGPFDNKEKIAQSEEYPPEKELDFTKEYEGIKYPVKWQKLKQPEVDNSFNLVNYFTPDSWVCAYLAAFVHSDSDLEANLSLAADDSVRVWLNDSLILEDDTYKAAVLDQHTVRVKLKKGYNKVLIKLLNGDYDWEFLLRFTDRAGNALNLKSSDEIQPYTPDTGRLNDYSGFRAAFESAAQTRPEIYASFTRAMYYSLTDLKDEAVKSFEAALKTAPESSVINFETGKSHILNENSTKGVALYKRAIELSDENSLGRLILAKYYYDNNLLKKSRDLLEELSKKSQAPEITLYRALIETKEGRTLEAIRLVKELAQKYPAYPYARFYLARFYENLNRVSDSENSYLGALNIQKDSKDFLNSLLGFYQSRAMFQKYEKIAGEYLRYYPLDKGMSFGLASIKLMQKDYAGSLATLEKYKEINPNDYNLWTKTGLIKIEQETRAAATSDFEKALSLEPNYLWLRDYMKILKPERELIFKKYARQYSDPGLVNKDKETTRHLDKAEAEVLLDQEIVQLYSDGSSSHRVHRIIRILTENGKNIYGQANAAGDQNLKILRAVTIKPSGEEIEATSISGRRISFADVDSGSVIDYEYTFDRFQGGWLKNQFYDRFFFQEYSAPVLFSEYILAAPNEKKYAYSVTNGTTGVVMSEETVDGLSVRIWRAKDMPQVYSEPNSPPYESLAARLSVSTIPSWDYLIKWEASLMKDQLRPDDKIKEKAQELTKDAKDTGEKTARIYDFITKEIRYLSTGDGIFGRRPFKASSVLSDKFGDCKNKSVLFMSMLKELGIKSEYILLKTKNEGRLQKDIPMPETNHAIIYVPETNQYLDGTGKYLTVGNIWHYDQGASALNVTNPNNPFFTLPVAGPDSNKKLTKDFIEVSENGDAKITSESDFWGVLAASARYFYENTGKQNENLEATLNQEIPGAEVISHDFKNIENQKDPVILNYAFTVPEFFERNGGRLFLKLTRLSNFIEQYAAKTERYYDIELDYFSKIMLSQKYKLPENLKVETLPQNFYFDNEYFSYSIEYKKNDASSVDVTRVFEFNKLLIPKSEYPKMREIFSKIDTAERERIVLTGVDKNISPKK